MNLEMMFGHTLGVQKLKRLRFCVDVYLFRKGSTIKLLWEDQKKWYAIVKWLARALFDKKMNLKENKINSYRL